MLVEKLHILCTSDSHIIHTYTFPTILLHHLKLVFWVSPWYCPFLLFGKKLWKTLPHTSK